jgi:hypothetical protein
MRHSVTDRLGTARIERLKKRTQQLLPILLVVCAFSDAATDTAVGARTLSEPTRRGYGIVSLSVVAVCQIISTIVVVSHHKRGKSAVPLWFTAVATLLGFGQGVMLYCTYTDKESLSDLVRPTHPLERSRAVQTHACSDTPSHLAVPAAVDRAGHRSSATDDDSVLLAA